MTRNDLRTALDILQKKRTVNRKRTQRPAAAWNNQHCLLFMLDDEQKTKRR